MALYTERLELREVSANDIQHVHALHSLKETDRFNTLGIPENIDVTGKIVKGWITEGLISPKGKFTYSAFLKDSAEFIGVFGINCPSKPAYRSAELWYKIHPTYWNKGYGTEAVMCLLKFCFNELKLHRVEAGCAVDNTASLKVLEKCGFTREGRKRKKLPVRGEWLDNYFYAILDEDFPERVDE